MRTNLWQALVVLLIVLGFVTLGAWVAEVGRPDVIWALRIGAPLAAAAVAWAMFAVSRRPDRIPDKLREVAARYFERNGLCFAPVVEAAGGASFLNVYFQNRHAGHATTRVDVMPGARSFRLARHPLPEVTVRIECPGGAFGVVHGKISWTARPFAS